MCINLCEQQQRHTVAGGASNPCHPHKTTDAHQHVCVIIATSSHHRCHTPCHTRSPQRASLADRAWSWINRWAERINPTQRSWGITLHRRTTTDHTTSSWPVAEIHMRSSQEQLLLHHHQQAGAVLSDQQGPCSFDAAVTDGVNAVAAGQHHQMTAAPPGHMPVLGGGASSKSLRRPAQLASCQASLEVLPASGAAVCGGSNNPLARVSQSSHLSHLSLLPDVRPDEQMVYLQQQIQWAMQKVGCRVNFGSCWHMVPTCILGVGTCQQAHSSVILVECSTVMRPAAVMLTWLRQYIWHVLSAPVQHDPKPHRVASPLCHTHTHMVCMAVMASSKPHVPSVHTCHSNTYSCPTCLPLHTPQLLPSLPCHICVCVPDLHCYAPRSWPKMMQLGC